MIMVLFVKCRLEPQLLKLIIHVVLFEHFLEDHLDLAVSHIGHHGMVFLLVGVEELVLLF